MQGGEFLQFQAQNLDIFDERNGVVTVIINKSRMGEIETVNPAMKRMLGYSQVHYRLSHRCFVFVCYRAVLCV